MTIQDQIKHIVEVPSPPMRIISLVPSQTELLYDLGLDERVVGITKFCIHPQKWWESKTRVGGTKKLHLDKIEELNPDLIIANKEENTKEEIESLQGKYPVYTSDIYNLEEALVMIADIGALTDTAAKASEIVRHIQSKFLSIPKLQNKKVAYAIWDNPIMLVGKPTFIDHMLEQCGLTNSFSKKRYPETTIEELQNNAPDYVFLSSEPYPFKENHQETFAKLLPQSKVILVDGEMFSWYGSRLMQAPSYFSKLLKQL